MRGSRLECADTLLSIEVQASVRADTDCTQVGACRVEGRALTFVKVDVEEASADVVEEEEKTLPRSECEGVRVVELATPRAWC